MQTARSTIDVEVAAISDLAKDIRRYDLVRCNGAAFPDVAPGAHVTLHMSADLARAYSLITSGAELRTYAIAVKHEPDGGGGSRFLHTKVAPGSRLIIDPPRNNFPLAPELAPSVFIAGGIGITPIWPMIEECVRRGSAWKLFYAARSRAEAAFAAELERWPNVETCFSDTRLARLDVRELVRTAPPDAHLYCCGSGSMLADFRSATLERPASHVHAESFDPAPIVADRHPISVRLARTGKTVSVPPDKSIAEAIFQAGVRVKMSCRQGNCGTCEVDVLEGVPDHQDDILTEAERASNKTMMVCCSWCKGDHLVLDL